MNDSPITVMVYVPDWKSGLEWYSQAFPEASVITEESGGFSYLDIKGVSLELVQADEKVSCGATGTVVYWRTTDFESRISYLESLGAVMFRGPMTYNGVQRMCQLKDPFGNSIGIRT